MEKSSQGYPLCFSKVFVSKTVVENNKLTLKFLTCIKTSNSMSCYKISNIQDAEKHYVCMYKITDFEQPYVKQFALCYWTIVLSPMLVYCDQMVGWINMKLGTDVGLGHTVLDGDPALTPAKKGAQPPIFGPHLLWTNGWMDKDATWYGDRRRPRRHCVRWGT